MKIFHDMCLVLALLLVVASPAGAAGDDPRLDRARKAVDGGNSRRALKILSPMLQDEACSADALALAASAEVGQGNPERAEAHLRRALELQPDHLPSLRVLASTLDELGRRDSAIEAYRRWSRLDPDDDTPRLGLVKLYHASRSLEPLLNTLARAANPVAFVEPVARLTRKMSRDEDRFRFGCAVVSRVLDLQTGQRTLTGVLGANLFPVDREPFRLYLEMDPPAPELELVVGLANCALLLNDMPETIAVPRRLDETRVVYPERARVYRKAGGVSVLATIEPDGSVRRIATFTHAGSEGHGFEAAAEASVDRRRYEPARKNGEPVPQLLYADVLFKLN